VVGRSRILSPQGNKGDQLDVGINLVLDDEVPAIDISAPILATDEKHNIISGLPLVRNFLLLNKKLA
jgi:hypothetical protein